jgi:hypothetical protein
MELSASDELILDKAETELENIRKRIAEQASTAIVIHAFGANFLRVCAGYGMSVEEYNVLVDEYKISYKILYETYVEGKR